MTMQPQRPTPPPSLIVRSGAALRFNVPRWLRPIIPFVDKDYWRLIRRARTPSPPVIDYVPAAIRAIAVAMAPYCRTCGQALDGDAPYDLGYAAGASGQATQAFPRVAATLADRLFNQGWEDGRNARDAALRGCPEVRPEQTKNV